jgi:SAM-dependent methyltransferase
VTSTHSIFVSALITTHHDGRLGGMPDPWNANIHYDARLNACVPASATSVLDAGCGDGFLAAQLATRISRVIAIDLDAPVLERARTRFPDANVTWCHGDMLTHPFERGSFDAVVSNAALHHLPDSKAALHRLSELVRPGGTLAIVGFARMQMRDWPWALVRRPGPGQPGPAKMGAHRAKDLATAGNVPAVAPEHPPDLAQCPHLPPAPRAVPDHLARTRLTNTPGQALAVRAC